MAWLNLKEAFWKVPQLLLKGEFAYTSDKIPIRVSHLSLKKRSNLVCCGIDELFRKTDNRSFPPIVQIEPTNICNLQCPLCPSSKEICSRERGMMRLSTFKRILDQLGDTLVSVVLYGWGEPFLNPELPDMIDLCSERGIHTLTSTNGQCLQSKEQISRVVEAGLKTLIIALDGSNQESYQAYRNGGEYEKVVRFVSLVEKEKAVSGSPYPYTNLRMVVNRYNQDEICELEELARKLGVNMFSCKSLGCLTEHEHYGDFEPTDSTATRFSRGERMSDKKKAFCCSFPFRQPTIFWDGTVVACEFDYNLEMPLGNILTDSFSEIWNSPALTEFRRNLNGSQRGESGAGFCCACPYRDRIQNSSVIQAKQLQMAL